MQVAVEYSQSMKCAGRILLDAHWDSHLFFRKLGMHPEREQDVKALEEMAAQTAATATRIDTSDLVSIPMYLPQASLRLWKAKIDKSQILYIPATSVSRLTPPKVQSRPKLPEGLLAPEERKKNTDKLSKSSDV